MIDYIAVFETNLTKSITDIVGKVISTASSIVGGILITGTIAYFITEGYKLMYTGHGQDVYPLGTKLMKFAIIASIISSGALFTAPIAKLVTKDAPLFLSKIVGGKAKEHSISGMIFAQVSEIQKTITKKDESWWDIYSKIINFFLSIIGAIVASIAFLISLIARISLSIIGMLAPLFISFAMFENTRGWFFNWLNMVFNLSLLLSLYVAVATIIGGAANTALASIIDSNQTEMNFMFIFVIFITLGMIFFQLPYIASALTSAGYAALSGSRGARAVGRQIKLRGKVMGGRVAKRIFYK